jgi:hypothetical protein
MLPWTILTATLLTILVAIRIDTSSPRTIILLPYCNLADYCKLADIQIAATPPARAVLIPSARDG